MPSIPLIELTRQETELPPADAIPVLNLPSKQDKDFWILRLIHAKRPFAIASPDIISADEILRLAETCKRRKLPVAILDAYRLLPVFARLKEIAVSGCLGRTSVLKVRIPASASAMRCADLALWLLPSVGPDAFSSVGDNRLTVVLSGPNGDAEASLNMATRDASLALRIGGATRAIAVPSATSPCFAERDILANAPLSGRRWPLLMHVDDAAAATMLAADFATNAKK